MQRRRDAKRILVELSQGLSGNCHFISRSPEFLIVNAPVITIVEGFRWSGIDKCDRRGRI